MAYYTLLRQDKDRDFAYGIEFGSPKRDECVAELEDLSSWHCTPRRLFKIICTKTSRQSEIDAAVTKLNAAF